MVTENLTLTDEQKLILAQNGIRNIEHLIALMEDYETLLNLTTQLTFTVKQLAQIAVKRELPQTRSRGFVEFPVMGLIEEKGDE